jgi:predicted phage-related endonuclease
MKMSEEMKMKYNKSEIMKRMHELVKEAGMNKSTALRQSWHEAKNPQDIAAKAREFKEIQKAMEELQAKAEAIKESIIAEMDGREELQADDYTIRYQTIVRNILDTQKLKAEQKELYNEYLKTNESKRFTIA